AGVHALEVTAPGYRPAKTALSVERGGTHRLTLELQREQGLFELDVEPRGGVVEIDGVDHGSRLRNAAVDTGEHALRVRKDGYYDRHLRWSATTDATRRGFISLAPAVAWTGRGNDKNIAADSPGDLNGDGLDDLVLVRADLIRAVDPWSDRVLWTLEHEGARKIATLVPDIDGDGVRELVTTVGDGADREMALWSPNDFRDGRPRARWRRRRGGDPTAPLGAAQVAALFDVDGDGRDELITSSLHGEVIEAVDVALGRPRWRSAPRAGAPEFFAIVLHGRRALLAGHNGRERFGLDARTGELLWQRGAEGPSGHMRFNQWVPDDESGAPVLLYNLGRDTWRLDATIAVDAESGARLWSDANSTTFLRAVDERDGTGALALVDSRDAEQLTRVRPRSGAALWRARVPGAITMVDGAPARIVARTKKGFALHSLDDARRVATFPLGGGVLGSPARWDWDGDGRDELLLTGRDGTLAAYDRAWRRVGSMLVDDTIRTIHPLGDVNHDGAPDLALNGRPNVYLITGTRERWARGLQGELRATPTVVDVTGDDVRELVIPATVDRVQGLYTFDGLTGELRSPALELNHTIIRPPARVGDDATTLELVYGDRQGLLRYSPTRGLITSPVDGLNGWASPTVADLTGDGGLELVSVPWTGAEDYAVRDAGTREPL
ncbi:MAG: PQQ-binding-like beta-propeller repeat protein, partial [Myxococcales bacterium]|nr:PQQ-binding-like beta-propeller repeat protein [Myxococcales bacterium]